MSGTPSMSTSIRTAYVLRSCAAARGQATSRAMRGLTGLESKVQGFGPRMDSLERDVNMSLASLRALRDQAREQLRNLKNARRDAIAREARFKAESESWQHEVEELTGQIADAASDAARATLKGLLRSANDNLELFSSAYRAAVSEHADADLAVASIEAKEHALAGLVQTSLSEVRRLLTAATAAVDAARRDVESARYASGAVPAAQMAVDAAMRDVDAASVPLARSRAVLAAAVAVARTAVDGLASAMNRLEVAMPRARAHVAAAESAISVAADAVLKYVGSAAAV